MGEPSLAAGLAVAGLAALATLAPAAAADGGLAVDPTPVPAEGTATVTADFGEPVDEARLQACRADADGAILSCFRPATMEPDGGGNWTATVPQGATFGGVAQAGFNASGQRPDGTAVHLPGGGEAYRFVAVAADEGRGLPGPGALAGAALGAGALVRSRP